MADSGDGSADAPGNPFEPAVDCHVHCLPERLLGAIRRALRAESGWEIPHPADREGIEATLSAAGVRRYVTLPYAHEAGVARELNAWVLDTAADSGMAIPFATVHPEDDVGSVVEDAFEAGARGLKFHCPVQECPPDDPRLDPAFEAAAEYDRPVLLHAGTAPSFADSPHVGADRFEAFVESYPEVRAACAHLGAFETDRFLELAREYDSVYLDTSFAASTAAREYAGFDPGEVPDRAFEELSGSIVYGSDFPNLPHEYAAERAGLLERDLSRDAYRDLFRRTAEEFLGFTLGLGPDPPR